MTLSSSVFLYCSYFLANLATADLTMKLYSLALCIAANRRMRNITLLISSLFCNQQRNEEYSKLFPVYNLETDRAYTHQFAVFQLKEG
jgi:hypothetical protein